MMATAKIRTLGPGTLTIGQNSDVFKLDADCTNVKLEPDSGGDTITFLDGTTESDEMTWKLSGTIKEDYSATGAQAYCFKNNGKTIPFTFIPNLKAAMKVTGKVAIKPLAIGGDVKTRNDQSFEFTASDVTMDFTNPVG